jgi:hypothetical protein
MTATRTNNQGSSVARGAVQTVITEGKVAGHLFSRFHHLAILTLDRPRTGREARPAAADQRPVIVRARGRGPDQLPQRRHGFPGDPLLMARGVEVGVIDTPRVGAGFHLAVRRGPRAGFGTGAGPAVTSVLVIRTLPEERASDSAGEHLPNARDEVVTPAPELS